VVIPICKAFFVTPTTSALIKELSRNSSTLSLVHGFFALQSLAGSLIRPFEFSLRKSALQEISLGLPSFPHQSHIRHSSCDNFVWPQVGFSTISLFISSISFSVIFGFKRTLFFSMVIFYHEIEEEFSFVSYAE